MLKLLQVLGAVDLKGECYIHGQTPLLLLKGLLYRVLLSPKNETYFVHRDRYTLIVQYINNFQGPYIIDLKSKYSEICYEIYRIIKWKKGCNTWWSV